VVLNILALVTRLFTRQLVSCIRSLNGMPQAVHPPWCLHRVGAEKSFLDIHISRCFDTETFCIRKVVSYSQ
jgi:hypothetical protein